MTYRNIAIVWDFDGTLTPDDSTSKIIEYFLGEDKIDDFWEWIKTVNGSLSEVSWERMLSSDAPTWMYVLSRIAFKNNIPLSKGFFSKEEITGLVELYPGVTTVLQAIDNFKEEEKFKKSEVKVHQFVITAGLKEYIEQLVPKEIFSYIWGGRYNCVYPPNREDDVNSIPVFCMDETMKTRALYEISKGVFNSTVKAVNKRVEKENLWCPFDNFIYIGDGPTDIPALSLTRTYGGYGIVVFNPDKDKEEVKKKLRDMSADSRCDLITKVDFSLNSDLFSSIKNRCNQILQKYEAEDFAQ